jgi:hypothetical protein
MKKSYLTVLLTLSCLLGLGISARAQDVTRVVVTVPFEFVAGGQTLPAGTYTLSRASEASQRNLVIRSYDNGAFVLPMAFDDIPAERAKLGFTHVGNEYFLSKVETQAGVYTFQTPRPMTKVAQMKDQGALSSSGTH